VFDIVDKYWPMSVGDGKATRKKRPDGFNRFG